MPEWHAPEGNDHADPPTSRIARWAILALALPLLAFGTRTIAKKLEAGDHGGRTTGALRKVSRLADRNARD